MLESDFRDTTQIHLPQKTSQGKARERTFLVQGVIHAKALKNEYCVMSFKNEKSSRLGDQEYIL